MNCDMCGSESMLFKAKIEGTIMNVCKNCSKYGKVLSSISPPVSKKKEKKIKKLSSQEKNIPDEDEEPETIEEITSDFAKKIRQKRDKLGLDQDQLAKKVNEKRSIIHKLETGELKPSIPLAEKLEDFLDIKLIEEIKEEKVSFKRSSSQTLTIGDMIKLKKK